MKDYASMSDCEIAEKIGKAIGLCSIGGCLYIKNGVWTRFDPCNNPADAWPILLENHIAVVPYRHTLPQAWPTAFGMASKFTTEHANPLRAGMIVFLMMQESANAQDNPSR